MSEIPGSIMRSARLAVIAVYIDSDFSPKCERVNRIRSGDNDDELVIQAAARAIMAEREACARIVEENDEWLNQRTSKRTLAPRMDGNPVGLTYAEAIRNR